MNKIKNKYVAHYVLRGVGPYLASFALKHTYIISPHPSNEAAKNNVNNPFSIFSKL